MTQYKTSNIHFRVVEYLKWPFSVRCDEQSHNTTQDKVTTEAVEKSQHTTRLLHRPRTRDGF